MEKPVVEEGSKKKSEEKKKEKPTKAAKEKDIRLHVQDAHQRLNFLHQIALQLSSQSANVDDGFAKLGRNIGKHFRGVLDTETVKVEPAMRRIFCKKCKQVFLAKSPRFELKKTQKKVIQRKCLLCGQLQNFEMNLNYRSRNEKHQQEMV